MRCQTPLHICPGKPLCSTCQLRSNQVCRGCGEEYYERCLKSSCFADCESCGGGKHATVRAYCGRSPLRDQAIELFNVPTLPYSPQAPDIKSTNIPIIYSQIAQYRIPEGFAQIDSWAVPVHKVMNLQGKFRSNDLKDYLGLPKDRKLILSTCAPDDFMEMLWAKGESLDFKGHGVDFWFPAHFSIYDDDCMFYQLYNAKRQQVHAVRVKSQFVWFRLGENIPVHFLAPIHGAGAILISCQQMYSARNRNILKREVDIAHRWFPRSTLFIFTGKGGLDLGRLAKDRRVFTINGRWILLALKGRTMNNQLASHLSRKELLISNLQEVCNENQW